LIQNDTARDQLLSDLPRAARVWLDVEYTRLLTEREGSLDADTAVMVRLLFALAARGNCVLVGRGAGYLLPHESILHVRLIAPFEARTAYFAQILRLNLEEAANEVRAQDERRNRFLTRTLGVNPADWYGYDLIVNSERLGVESASQFIGWAVRTKQQFLEIQESEEHLRLADHPGLR
jgi:cytidylate kinase